MEYLEEKFNIQTTSTKDSIASSFTNDENYFVSTVNQQKHQPEYPTKYCSIIKIAGPSFHPILSVDANSAREASENHIALVRMGTSYKKDKWSHKVLDQCQPVMISNLLINQSMYPDDFSSDYCINLIRASGINISSGGMNFNSEEGMNIDRDIAKSSLWFAFVIIAIILIFTFS